MIKVRYTTTQGQSSTAYVVWDGIAWVGMDKHTDEPVRLFAGRGGWVVATYCDVFWGSHGCDLPPGHDGDHVCDATDPDGPCSVATLDGWVRFYGSDGTLDEGGHNFAVFHNGAVGS